MRLPAPTASSEVHLNYAAHIDGACEAWKDAEIITPEQQATIAEVGDRTRDAADELRVREAAAEEAARATSRARARFGVRDVILDLRVMATSDGVLNGPALRNREHPIYKNVFLGSSPTEITRAKMREEPELVGRVRERLAGVADFPAKGGLVAELDTTLERSITARTALEMAEDAENKAGDAELAARLGLRHAIEQAYGTLRAAFPGRRDFVESFFPKRDPAAKSQAGEPDAPETPAETQAEPPAEPPAETAPTG
jgi:hypothetical protein